MLKLLAFVLPLGLDSFAVAAAIGAAGPVTAGQRLRISVIFVAFEAGMPLIGLTLGNSLAHAIGDIADYLVAVAVIGVGAWMVAHGDDDDEQAAGRLLGTSPRPLRLNLGSAIGGSPTAWLTSDHLKIAISLSCARARFERAALLLSNAGPTA